MGFRPHQNEASLSLSRRQIQASKRLLDLVGRPWARLPLWLCRHHQTCLNHDKGQSVTSFPKSFLSLDGSTFLWGLSQQITDTSWTSVIPTWTLVRITPVETWRNGALSHKAQEGQLDLKRSLRRSDLKDVLHSISQTITVHIGGWNLRKVREQPIQRLRGMKKVQCE